MKKITLLVASIFLFGGIIANAADRNNRKSPVDYRNAEPIAFTERGIQFFVYTDGQFDFNERSSNVNVRYNSNKKNVMRGNVQQWNNGVDVEQDRSGRIRRVGNVFLSYDSHNRIKQIGSVSMDYNRYGLTQVGGLQITYNHYKQIIAIYGDVYRNNNYQYSNRDYDNHNDYKSYTNKVVTNSDSRLRR